MIEVRPAEAEDTAFVRRTLEDGWGGPHIAVHGALRFYQRRGFDLAAVHRDAVTEARRLKPSIPPDADGIPIRHELELRLDL
jgi:hypothetical protein